jgi:hypothetical protein
MKKTLLIILMMPFILVIFFVGWLLYIYGEKKHRAQKGE